MLPAEIAEYIKNRSSEYFKENLVDTPVLNQAHVRYWSIIFVCSAVTISGKKHTIYCKMPKSDWAIDRIDKLAFDKESKNMALEEFNSLQNLYDKFKQCTDKSIGVIKPLAYLPELNAILTEGVADSTDSFALLRSSGSNKKISNDIESILKKMGALLSYIHISWIQDLKQYRVQPTFMSQIEDSVYRVKNLADRDLANRIIKYLHSVSETAQKGKLDQTQGLVIEGFEVRNFINTNNSVFFLDPGKILVGSRYEDLARFIASLGLLYWKNVKFIQPYRNERRFINLFLDGYEEKSYRIDRKTLYIFLAKQFIELWLDSLKVLDFKKWPKPVKSIIKRIYIERFFSNKLDCLIKAL